MILEDAKEFRLKFERNFTDFIEKQGPAIRQFHASNLLTDAPVKAPRSWPNNSLSSKTGGDGGTIDLDEGKSRAAAQAMNSASKSVPCRFLFLPRSGL